MVADGGGILKMSKLKRKRKRRHDRKDNIPFSHVRKKVPRPGSTMRSDKDYSRKEKHPTSWEDTG